MDLPFASSRITRTETSTARVSNAASRPSFTGKSSRLRRTCRLASDPIINILPNILHIRFCLQNFSGHSLRHSCMNWGLSASNTSEAWHHLPVRRSLVVETAAFMKGSHVHPQARRVPPGHPPRMRRRDSRSAKHAAGLSPCIQHRPGCCRYAKIWAAGRRSTAAGLHHF